MKVSNRQELVEVLTEMLANTPEEFIDYENVVIEQGEEYIVDGDPNKEYYPGCRLEIVRNSVISVRIPIVRKPVVYGYYAEKLEDEIDLRQESLTELEKMKELFRVLGRSKTTMDARGDEVAEQG